MEDTNAPSPEKSSEDRPDHDAILPNPPGRPTDIEKTLTNTGGIVTFPESQIATTKPATPVETSSEAQQEKSSLLKPLRTYREDVASFVKERKESVASIAAKEHKRRIETLKQRGFSDGSGAPREYNPTLIGLIILFLVAGGAALAVFFLIPNDRVEPIELPPSFIFSDASGQFDVTRLSGRKLLQVLALEKAEVSLPLGSIETVFLTTEEGERSYFLDTSQFLSAIDGGVPGTLKRSLDRLFTFGIHVFDGNQPFLIFKTPSYENAFAAMLSWERTMRNDLSPLFDRDIIPREGTTTPSAIPGFVDRVIKNKDTRIARDEEGNVLLLYSFVDRETLVITTNEHTFTEIFTRLSSTRITR